MNCIKKKKIAIVPGDGIGEEIMQEAIKVVKFVGNKYGIGFEFKKAYAGGAAIDRFGSPYPEETKKICSESDAILFGAVGGPKWDNMPAEKRPEKAILGLRKDFDLFANFRPIKPYKEMEESSKIKNIQGTDIMIVRELTSDVYFGKKETRETYASDIMSYTADEIRRAAKVAFSAAMKRRKKVTCVDKANVLATSKFWRKIVGEVAIDFPEVTVDYMYVDNCAMQIIMNPQQFDVIVTGNMFGDIISDEASVICGSIGFAPSASIGSTTFGLYEPIHGSAPDIAGKGIANPIAQILSAAMMFRHSFGMEKAAAEIESAVERAIAKGYKTRDICKNGIPVSTSEMGDRIIAEMA